eukprot:364329-Chlamydomonas_euryale.AAC.13
MALAFATGSAPQGFVHGMAAAADACASAPLLLCLDDDCLLRVLRHLSPLPDLFNVSRACRVSRSRQGATQTSGGRRAGNKGDKGSVAAHGLSLWATTHGQGAQCTCSLPAALIFGAARMPPA